MKRHAIVYAVLLLLILAARLAGASTFVDNGDGTISDQGTNLMWQKQDDGTIRNWADAITYCEGLILAGRTDWRLPTIKELKSITDMTKYNPSINTTYFPGTKSDTYWTSTTFAGSTANVWLVHFLSGYTPTNAKTGTHYVRCVR